MSAVCPKSLDSQCFRILLLSVDVGPLKVGRAAIYQGFSHGKDFAGTLRKGKPNVDDGGDCADDDVNGLVFAQ